MGNKLYVGNLSYGVTASQLETLFGAHGTVQSAEVISDRDTGRSKGFGFVEMGSDQEAQAAITALHGTEMEGRALTVNEAKPRPNARMAAVEAVVVAAADSAAGLAVVAAAKRQRWRRRWVSAAADTNC